MVVKRKSKEIDYPLIHQTELQEREKKHILHIENVKICWSLVQDARARYNYLTDEKHKLNMWEKYLKCDILPKPWCPQQIRLFLERLRYFERDNCDKTMDWTLAVEEKSLLSQDISRVDLTRKRLNKILCPNLGEYYDKYINQCLSLLQDIDRFTDNEYQFSLISLPKAKDIISSRHEVDLEISDAFGKFTYRIISAKDTYMHSDDGIETFYSYEGKDFTMDIWALRDVCVRFDQLELPFMLAKFPSIGIIVQIPLSCLFQNLILRCVHCSFDSYSPQAKTYEQVVTKPAEDVLGGIPDVIEELIKEWEMQMDIMYDIRSKMSSEYTAFEEVLKLVELKEAELKKIPQEERSKFKMPKLPKKPTHVADDMYPDTFHLLREREQSQYQNFMFDFFHPDQLNLLPNQVNLRKYIISGGTYNLFFLSPPKHTDFDHFNITSHVNNHKLIILKDIVAELDYFYDDEESEATIQQRGSASRRRTTVLSRIEMSRSRAQENPGVDLKDYKLGSDDLPYFFVTLQLPEDICRWGWPTVCHFEESETEIEELPELDEALVPRPPKPPTMAPFEKKHSIVQTVDENESGSDLEVNMKRYTASINKSGGALNALTTRHSTLLRNSVLTEKVLAFNVKPVQQKSQIRALERYCLPHIISSFEFPVEIIEHQSRTEEKQPNARVLTIKRKGNLTTLDEVGENSLKKLPFSFEDQNRPEYVFPIFDDIWDQMKKLNLENRGYHNEIKDLTYTFDGIRKKYIDNPKKIFDQKEFEVKKIERRKSDFTAEMRASVNWLSLKKMKLLNKKPMDSGAKLSEQSSLDLLKTLDINDFISPTRALLFASEKEEKEEPKVYKKVYHWTRNHIFDSHIDEANMKIILKTDRLGIFGLAFNRYAHFPFHHWSLRPNELRADELIFTLDTPHIHIELNITNEGFTGFVTDLQKQYVAKPIKYLVIDEPILEFKELKKRFLEKNMNIFPNVDASFYIKKGYFSEKHLATENHVYETIALHSLLMKFSCSSWNRLAQRNDLILCLLDAKERDDSFTCTVRVTPQEAKFVEIRELCSDQLDTFNLQYTPTWRNINFYADLHHLIISMSSKFTEGRNENPMIMTQVLTLLTAIRPLSFG